MASLSELKTDEELERWGMIDARRQTEALQQLPKKAGRFQFITKKNKREVYGSTCSLEEFTRTKHVMQLVSRPNTATYLRESVNLESASMDFKKFLTFVDQYPDPGKSELSTLVFPIFVYFYLLLLRSGPSGLQNARAFFKKNKDIFAHEESYDNVLEALYSLRTWTDVKEHIYYMNFLKCKYNIGISQDVLFDLRKYIESLAEVEGDKALLYVLHFHIHFQDDDEPECIKTIKKDLPRPRPRPRPTPTSKRSECESMEFESIPISELLSFSRRDSKSKGVKFANISDFAPVGYKSKTFPSKSSDSDSESITEEDDKSDSELEDLLKDLSISHPPISTIVTKCAAADLSSVDFNDGVTEIAYALESYYIYIAPLGLLEQKKRSIVENIGDDTRKKPRLDEETMEIVPSSPPAKRRKSSVVEGSKTDKYMRSENSFSFTKGSKKSKIEKHVTFQLADEDETGKADEDETGKDIDFEKKPQVRGMREIRVSKGENVYIVKYLPERPHELLAVCDTKVRLFNSRTECFEAEYDMNHGSIFDIDINSTSQYFATANMNLVSCLYSFDMSTEIQSFAGHLSAVTMVKFHPNGLYIATGSDDATVRLYDIESGFCIRRFTGYMTGISALAFPPDGKLLACGDSSGVVKIWDIKDGWEISDVYFSKKIETLAKITTLCFHNNSSILIALNHKGECKVWNVRYPESLKKLNFKDIPLKVKFCKNGVWKIAMQHRPK